MKEIIEKLKNLESAVKQGLDSAKISGAIEQAITATDKSNDPALKQLKEELATWKLKLSVILKEPAARQGMVKHAEHWIHQLRNGQ